MTTTRDEPTQARADTPSFDGPREPSGVDTDSLVGRSLSGSRRRSRFQLRRRSRSGEGSAGGPPNDSTSGSMDGLSGWSAEHTRARDSAYPPGRAARIFLWCGGVDRELLITRIEHYRYINLGVFVVLIAILAGVTFIVYASTISGAFTPMFLPFALLWAVLIFFLDRSIVAEPSYGDVTLRFHHRRRINRRSAGDAADADTPGGNSFRPQQVATGAVKAGAYLFRIVVALLVAYLIGEAILLVLFRPEIQREIAQRQAGQLQEAAQVYVTSKQGRIEFLDGELTARTEQRKATLANEQLLLDQLNGEANGTGGSRLSGDGRLTRLAEEKYRAAVQARQQLERDHIEPDRVQSAEKATLSGEIEAIKRGDKAAVAAIPALQRELELIVANTGWVEQEAALAQFLDANRGQLTVTAVPWIVRGILLAIDLVPLILKLANGTTIYGQRQRDRAAQLRYADAAENELLAEHTDRMAAVDRLRSESARDVAREREQWQRDWRLHYLESQQDAVRKDRRGTW